MSAPSGHVKEGKGTVPREAREEAERVAVRLAELIQKRGLSVRRVEKMVGWPEGTLHLVLTGKTPLRFSHAAAVCSAIGFPLPDFYRDLAAPADAPARPAPPLSPEIVPGLTEDELMENVRRLIRQYRQVPSTHEGE